MNELDFANANLETMEAVCQELAKSGLAATLPAGHPLISAMAKLRSEHAAPVLRTRGERDRELVELIAKGRNKGRDWECPCTAPREVRVRVAELLDEPTAEPDPHLSESGKRAKALERDGLPDLDLSPHEVCSCDEAEALRATVAELKTIVADKERLLCNEEREHGETRAEVTALKGQLRFSRQAHVRDMDTVRAALVTLETLRT